MNRPYNRYLKTLLALLAIYCSSACMLKKDGIELHIKNESDQQITQVEFSTTEELDVISIDGLAPKQKATEFLSMRKNKLDGSYLLKFTRANGKQEIIKGGYYTNGSSRDYWVDVLVQNDTTIVKFDAPIF